MSRRPLLDVVAVSGNVYPTVRSISVWIGHSSTYQRPETPIFHAILDHLGLEFTDEQGRLRKGWEVTAACGPHIGGATWLRDAPNAENDYRSDDCGIRIPLRWAVQFAIPCRRCWP